MVKTSWIVSIGSIALLAAGTIALSSEVSNKDRIYAVVGKMVSAIEELDDLISETEVTYYSKGEEDRRYQLTYFFKKEGYFRVNFSSPFPGLTVFYKRGDDKLTVKPFRFLPLKFSFSIYNRLVRTPSGQRIDQADVRYLIEFLFRNTKWIDEKESEYLEERTHVEFLFWAKDYLEEKTFERYRVFVSSKNWLPQRIERYDKKGNLIEIAVFTKYTINSHLENSFFLF
jgi:outer membrane lipoprotein-sorting protein